MRTQTIVFLFTVFASVALFSLSYGADTVIDLSGVKIITVKGFSFKVYDKQNPNHTYPSFRFAVRLPDGNLIGWDKESGQWTGVVEEIFVKNEEFNFPDPQSLCSSFEPYTGRKIFFQSNPDMKGSYSSRNAIYCRDIFSGEKNFIGSALTGAFNETPEGVYAFEFYPEGNVIIFMSADMNIIGIGATNELGLNPDYNRQMILTKGMEQKILFNYDYASKGNTTVTKVVTPATLSGSWESCYQMGMIKNQGLYNSIKQKLDNASRKAASGDQKAAANIYSAVANELKAQYGKGIDRMCADILAEDLKSDVR